MRDCVVCLVVSSVIDLVRWVSSVTVWCVWFVLSLLLIWSGGCREGLCGVFGCVVFVIDLVMWVS